MNLKVALVQLVTVDPKDLNMNSLHIFCVWANKRAANASLRRRAFHQTQAGDFVSLPK